MHWSVEQVLWALVLAGHLVLLIVLLGKDRAKRFPWFTTVIVLSAARLLADHLLSGKLTTIAFYWQSYTATGLDALLTILVLVELCRAVFSSRKTGLRVAGRGWAGWTLVTLGIAGGVVWAWGPWPAWQALRSDPVKFPLLMDVLIALKLQMLVAVLTIEAALLMRFFGRRFGAGWKSHAQQIALGLSTNCIAFLTVQGITDSIKRTVHLTSREQYDRIVHLLTNMDNARFALWVLVLGWWIFWLWREESQGGAAGSEILVPVEAGPTLVAGAEADTEATA